MMNSSAPTPHPDVNAFLQPLLTGINAILGSDAVAIYLDGSLANGDFDAASDIDFLVVTERDITPQQFAALKQMHINLVGTDSPWAVQLEGSYLSRQAIRRYDPEHALHPNLERGPGEVLKMADHDAGWLPHRIILRERGIVLQGPPARELIDPVPPEQLTQAMRAVLRDWAAPFLTDPERIQSSGYQSYIVLSLCRILYTLRHAQVATKRQAMRWGRKRFGQPWRELIDLAWTVRADSDRLSMREQLPLTLDFIRFALAKADDPATLDA